MADVGHNNPPSQIEFSTETVKALSDWMKDHPVIETEDHAREAKLLADRASLCSKDMRDERLALTRPLDEQITAINDRYRQPQDILSRTTLELKARLGAFIRREEERRKAEAERLRKEAEEAERLAREAEAREQAAKEDAQQGVTDLDIGEVTREADETFSRFKSAARQAQRADKDTHVKIGGGFGRAQSLRNRETLKVDDWETAIMEMELPESIIEAILKEARAYRRRTGKLPKGISSHTERA